MSKPFKLSDADVASIRTAEECFGSAEIRACVRDLFVLGLYLRLTGEGAAGTKACSLALRTLGISDSRKRRILHNLDGNEHTLYNAFQAHAEFNSLMERHQKNRHR